jgi:hypothetical protein
MYSQNQLNDADTLPETSGIGMYEMLAQAQPDLNFDHSSLLDLIFQNVELPEIVDE